MVIGRNFLFHCKNEINVNGSVKLRMLHNIFNQMNWFCILLYKQFGKVNLI